MAKNSRSTRSSSPNLRKSILSPDLMQAIARARPTSGGAGFAQTHPPVFDVIIEMNVDMPGGAEAARNLLFAALGLSAQQTSAGVLGYSGPRLQNVIVGIQQAGQIQPSGIALDAGEAVAGAKSLLTERYVFARFSRTTIEAIADLRAQFDAGAKPAPLVYKIWLDRDVAPFVFKSSKTIKADAAAIAFSALGEGIVWAVADTGIDASHPHFTTHANLTLPEGLRHLDFTRDDISFDQNMQTALADPAGHGTHVAGIIAGECRRDDKIKEIIVTREVRRDERTTEDIVESGPESIAGVAPRCKLLSLRVLDDKGRGKVSSLIAALGYVWRANDQGKRIRIHGVNLSVGYEFEAEWFAAGKSPLCNEVDQLVRSGVVVVAAAGNAGFGRVNAASGRQEQATLAGTIADPGNAELAITVGSTHRDMPHAFGVSYFSSKGPTADGRIKPDILAPGERIISCAAKVNPQPGHAYYREDSGTSMAAPHVSGAIAAFLSIRQEFIREPEEIKRLFLSTATDLKRLPHYQGRGLIDLMRAIQSR